MQLRQCRIFVSTQLTNFGVGDGALKVNWRFDTKDPNGKTFDPLMDLLHFVVAAKGAPRAAATSFRSF